MTSMIRKTGYYLQKAIISLREDGNENNNAYILEKAAFAIEPFATTGQGKIYEGAGGNIYKINELKNTRDPTARKILDYIYEKHKTLPFSLREIYKKFGNISRIMLKQLEQQKIIHHFPQLIEKSHEPVSQAEHTIIKTAKGIIVTTK